jgi:hypothetical protein
MADPAQTELGQTDAQGRFVTTWKRFFPHLYPWEDFTHVDEAGNVLGQFNYTGMVRIILTDPDKAGSQSYDVAVGGGRNTFDLVWGGGKSLAPEGPVVAPPVAVRRGGGSEKSDPIPAEFEVLQNRPNPFN